MRRRTRGLLFAFVLAVFAGPAAAQTQPPARVARIGVLGAATVREPFAQGLRELGHADYRTFVIEWRYGDPDTLPALAAELVRLNVDVIVTGTTPGALAAKRATRTIPIVAIENDPVAAGLVASLARPGGNVTGLSLLSTEVAVKRLQLLKEAVPRAARVAVLWSAYYERRGDPIALKAMQDAAASLGLKLVSLGARRSGDLEDAVATAVRARADAVVVSTDTVGYPQDARLRELLARHRLPAMFDRREHVEAGGLLSFGVSEPAAARRAAAYVDRILKGARPADLPVEQPTTFELVVNLRTARALGLTLPQSILIRADRVIQ